MLPESKTEALMYTTNDGGQQVYVYSYPAGDQVGVLSGFQAAEGLCVDQAGDVFVADVRAQDVVEYAHGGTEPIATLNDNGNYPNGCAVDPATGNLAVAGGLLGGANVAIYSNARGAPVMYQDPFDTMLIWCAYDSRSDLFFNPWDVYGGEIVELPSGSSGLVHIYVNHKMNPGGGIVWDGKHVVVGNPAEDPQGPSTLYKLAISGSSATVIDTVTLSGGRTKHKDKNPRIGNQFWLLADKVNVLDYTHNAVGVWQYPAGGYANKLIHADGGMGLEISPAPQQIRLPPRPRGRTALGA